MNPKKIFVVDDEPGIVKFMEKALVKNGYQVSASTDPRRALEDIAREPYDVIITDLRMPQMSGIELLEKVKSSGVSAEVVVVTAHATTDTAIECLRKGAADYLIKPFEINEMLATVGKVVGIGELKSRLVSLEEMDKLKDEFIATITHEIKTPLMAISGAIELLAMQDELVAADEEKRREMRRESDQAVKKFLKIIDRQSRKMKALVEDILDFARMEAGKLEIKKSPASLAEITVEVLSEVRPIAEVKGIIIAPPATDASVNCDREQIKRVVANLLTNAVKYTRPGGKITVEVSPPSESFAGVSVSDDGIGLTPEHSEKIFEKFFRADQSLRRETGGFGLGLSIAQKIIEAHGGQIRAQSEGPGKGTTVSFKLPV
ncbi:MAG: response regulator [Endomicrobiia bacterium]|nr:response regulator [Endomicrobiia bacterium]